MTTEDVESVPHQQKPSRPGSSIDHVGWGEQAALPNATALPNVIALPNVTALPTFPNDAEVHEASSGQLNEVDNESSSSVASSFVRVNRWTRCRRQL